MAKELPYFKFFVSEWNDGRIVDCSMEAQGLFINICSLYWSRLGNLDDATAMRKLCQGNAKAYKELKSSKIIKVLDKHISIDFLDEQLGERKQVSDEARKRALLRWEKQKPDANAMPTHSPRNANAMQIREEEKREEREKKQTAFGPPHSHFVVVKSKYLHEATARINGKAGLIEYMEHNQTVLNLPEHADKFMRANNGKVFNELSHLQNAYSLYIEKQFK